MRYLLVYGAAAMALAVLPSGAVAASATLTNPANGAAYYTGGGVAAQVPVTASRDLTGCTNGPGTS